MKPVAFMKGEVLETLHPQDCFYAFASPAKGATMGLYSEDQVRELLTKAARWDWIVADHRGDYVWNNVLSDKHRNLDGDHLENIVDKAIELGL